MIGPQACGDSRKQFLGLPVKITYITTLLLMPFVSWMLFSSTTKVIKPDWLNNQSTEKTTGWANNGAQQLDITIFSDLALLEQQLTESGWQKHEPRTWGNVYLAMQADEDSDDLPLFSYVHRGEVEHLLMSKIENNQLIAFRIWDDDPNKEDFWRGSLTRHKKDTDLYLFNHWGYKENLNDKSIVIKSLQSPYFVTSTMPDGSLQIIKKRK